MTARQSSDELRRARRAYLWVGVVAPVAIIAALLIVTALLLPSVPDPIATHWSGAGPDGFSPRWTALVIAPGIALALIAVFAIAVFASSRPRDRQVWDAGPPVLWGPTARFVGGVALGMSAMFLFVSTASLVVQLGLADARQAPDIGVHVLAGFAILVLFSAIGYALQPRVRYVLPEETEQEARESEGQLPIEWTGSASMSTSGRVTLGVLFGISFALLVPLSLAPDSRLVSLITLGVVIVVGVFAAITAVLRVEIDETGLSVRFLAPWPRFHYATADIARVRVYDVNPFAEFGGWGVRKGLDGRTGYVLRRGVGLELTLENGRAVVVTVDDAQTAAAVLRGVAQRANPAPPLTDGPRPA